MGGAAGQLVYNQWTGAPLMDNVGWAALSGAVTGAAFSAVGYGLGSVARRLGGGGGPRVRIESEVTNILDDEWDLLLRNAGHPGDEALSVLFQRRGKILVLGRIQSEVDKFAGMRATHLGENTYTVATEPLEWMSKIERWAAVTGEGTWRTKVRDSLNFVSDAQQVAQAKTIYQNTWDWRGSPYTVFEMVQTQLWKMTGLKDIVRFHLPWGR